MWIRARRNTDCWAPSQPSWLRPGWAREDVCCCYGDHTARTTATWLSLDFPYCLPSVSALTPRLILLCPLSFVPILLTCVLSLEGRGHRGALLCFVTRWFVLSVFFSDSLIFKYVLNSWFPFSQLLRSHSKVNLRNSGEKRSTSVVCLGVDRVVRWGLFFCS